MSMDEFDIKQETPAATLNGLRQEAQRLADVQREAEALEMELKALNSEIHNIRSRKLPDMFLAAGLQSLRLEDGREIALVDIVSGSLPKESARRSEAVRELEREGAGGMVKRKLTVEFERGSNRLAEARELLMQHGFKADENYDVHPMSLQAWARERMRDGLGVNGEVLGLFIGKTAKVKEPRR